jgi:F0F1-type ATP synthase epsilon subunit
MQSEIIFHITSPDKADKVIGLKRVILPGVEGEIGIHAGHSALFSTLLDGDIDCIYIDEGEESIIKFKVTGGLAVIENNLVEITTSSFTRSEK